MLLLFLGLPARAAFVTVDCLNTTHLNALGIPYTECQALEAFWDATGGPSWKSSNNWDSLNDINTWEGLTSTGGHVTAIELPFNNITGMIPAEISQLIYLQQLDLSLNDLAGNLPEELFSLTALQAINLGTNYQITSLPAIQVSFSSLQELYLDRNQISTLPTSISNLSQLSILSLSSNALTSLPVELGNIGTLNQLNLSGNQLTAIPAELGLLLNLVELNLSRNQLTSLPAALGDLMAINKLYLGDNQLTSLPTELGNLNTLKQLYLNDNQLSTLPGSFSTLTALTLLDLSGNRFTSLPNVVPSISYLQNLRLDNNLISTMPNITGLFDLQSLTMENNQLDFATMESLHATYLNNLSYYTFSPQGSVDSDRTIAITSGDTLTITPELPENPSGNDQYQWYRNGNPINTTAGTQRIYSRSAATANDAGEYTYRVTNTQVSGLTLRSHSNSRSIQVNVAGIYSLGGTVSGLNGSLTLQNTRNGEELVITGNGSFAFPTLLASMASYSVEVSVFPAGQGCVVQNGSGLIYVDVNDIQVSCSPNQAPVALRYGDSVLAWTGQPFNLYLTDWAADPDGDMLSFSPLSSQPAWLKVSSSGDMYSSQPITDVTAGYLPLSYRATDPYDASVDVTLYLRVVDSVETVFSDRF